MKTKPSYEELAHKVKELENEFFLLKEEDKKNRIFHKFFNLTREPVGMADLNGSITYANQALRDLLGKKEILGANVREFYSEEDLPALETLILPEVLKKGHQSVEVPLKRWDGAKIPVKQSLFRIDDDEGKPLHFANVISDISQHKEEEERLGILVRERTINLEKANKELQLEIIEHKNAQEELRESEEKYRLITETSMDGIYQIFTTGKFIYLNDAIVKIGGYEKEEVLNMPFSDFIIERDLPRAMELFAELSAGKSVEAELTCKHKDGHNFLIYFNAVPTMVDGKLDMITGVMRDITERRQMETQLQQAQRMEAIGTLAGGIAHDFNNILGAIIGYTELTLEEMAENEKARRRLEKVLQSGLRARDLVGQILTFSRQTKKERKTISVSPIIKEALKLLRATLPATIQIHQHLKTETDLIFGDPVQIHQVLMNLCTNAKHAMRREGGTLEVSLTEVALQSDQSAAFFHLDPGRFLKLTVSDTGHGIPHDITERLFDPYFTTKEKGEGTGLGLSVVHGIVTEHGGAIEVSSEVGTGTAFHIFLPLSEDQRETPQKPEKPILRGSENILLVDDEELLTEIYGQILESLGYQVVAKTSSNEALEVFRLQPTSFDLVLTDYTMPDMTGIQFAEALLKIRPDIPIILYSGFAEGISLEIAKSKGIKDMLSKPLSTHILSEALRKCLS